MPSESALTTGHHQKLVLEIIRQLSRPNDRWVTVAEVTEALNGKGYQVAKHSVRRYLNALVESYPQLECNDNSRDGETPGKGLAYGYRWVGKDAPPPTGLTIDEALSLVLVERYLGQALPATLTDSLRALFAKAAHTLEANKKSPAAHWPEKIAVIPPAQPLIPPKIDPAIQREVHEALIEDRQLRIKYHAPNREDCQERVLHPLGLVQRGPVSYLAATAWQYLDVRLYALHRISEATKLDEPCSRLEGFDIARYAEEQGHFGSGEIIQLVAKVSPGLKNILEETRLSEDQAFSGPDENGWYEMSATVRDTWQLRWWLFAQTGKVVVVSPEHLEAFFKKACGNPFEIR